MHLDSHINLKLPPQKIRLEPNLTWFYPSWFTQQGMKYKISIPSHFSVRSFQWTNTGTLYPNDVNRSDYVYLVSGLWDSKTRGLYSVGFFRGAGTWHVFGDVNVWAVAARPVYSHSICFSWSGSRLGFLISRKCWSFSATELLTSVGRGGWHRGAAELP